MYHKTLEECLRRIKDMKDSGQDQRKIGIMVASHNEDTVRFAIQKMKEIGVEPEDKVICFGQLLGMCDFITFPLGWNFVFVFFAFIRLFLRQSSILKVNLVIPHTSTYRTVRSTKCYLTCPGGRTRIKVS